MRDAVVYRRICICRLRRVQARDDANYAFLCGAMAAKYDAQMARCIDRRITNRALMLGAGYRGRSVPVPRRRLRAVQAKNPGGTQEDDGARGAATRAGRERDAGTNRRVRGETTLAFLTRVSDVLIETVVHAPRRASAAVQTSPLPSALSAGGATSLSMIPNSSTTRFTSRTSSHVNALGDFGVLNGFRRR